MNETHHELPCLIISKALESLLVLAMSAITISHPANYMNVSQASHPTNVLVAHGEQRPISSSIKGLHLVHVHDFGCPCVHLSELNSTLIIIMSQHIEVKCSRSLLPPSYKCEYFLQVAPPLKVCQEVHLG